MPSADDTPRQPLCSRCGGSTWEEVGPNERRCVECDLGATVSSLTFEEPRTRLGRWWARRGGLRRLRELDRETERAFGGATFPIYGLDDRWQGTRWFGGWGGSNGGVHHLVLAHGEAPLDTRSPEVRVESRTARRSAPRGVPADVPLEFEERLVTQELIQWLWHETGTLPAAARDAAYRGGPDDPDPRAPWNAIELAVDGEPIRFHMLAQGAHWVAQARTREVVIGIHSRSWPLERTGLVSVSDLAPYAGGSRLIRARGATWHAGETETA